MGGSIPDLWLEAGFFWPVRGQMCVPIVLLVVHLSQT